MARHKRQAPLPAPERGVLEGGLGNQQCLSPSTQDLSEATFMKRPFDRVPYLLAVSHIGPLPGNPRYGGSIEPVIEKAVKDARAAEEGGADGVIIENYLDHPYPKDRAGPLKVAAMAVIVREVVKAVSIPVGVSILRNCGPEAAAVAHASGASFIRVNALAQAVVSDQGVLEPAAYRLAVAEALMRWSPYVMADVNVKHAAPLTPRPLREVIEETVVRGGADAVIVTGPATGRPPSPEEVAEAGKHLPPGADLVVGSGVTPDNVGEYLGNAHGFIVGTYLKGRDGGIDPARVRALTGAMKKG